jgi:hypothetical protein
MNDIQPRLNFTARELILSRHHEECDRGSIEHLRKACHIGCSGNGNPIEFIPRQLQTLMNEVLELSPDG